MSLPFCVGKACGKCDRLMESEKGGPFFETRTSGTVCHVSGVSKGCVPLQVCTPIRTFCTPQCACTVFSAVVFPILSPQIGLRSMPTRTSIIPVNVWIVPKVGLVNGNNNNHHRWILHSIVEFGVIILDRPVRWSWFYLCCRRIFYRRRIFECWLLAYFVVMKLRAKTVASCVYGFQPVYPFIRTQVRVERSADHWGHLRRICCVLPFVG